MAESASVSSDGSDIDVPDIPDSDGNTSENDVETGELLDEGTNGQRDVNFRGFFMSDSDSDDDFDGFDGGWKREGFHRRRQRPYTGTGGSNVQKDPETHALDYFEEFWDATMWNHLVTETNRYADEERTANPPPPFAARWTPVTVPVMKAFIGK